MKILFTYVLIITFNCAFIQAQPSIVRKIDNRKAYIDKNINRFKKKTIEDSLGTVTTIKEET